MGKHFSFIHCADLHLGEPFGGLYSGDTGPWTEAIHKATFKAFENVVTAALTYRADAILISGDVYNSDHHSLAAQMAFARELYRAAQAGVQVFIIHGNHDPDEAWRADVPLPPSVYVFSSDKVESVPLLVGGETAAMVYGISYKNRHMRENLALRFRKKDEDIFSIGMLHTELGVAGSPYAPCTVDDLRTTKMDYWALGHVHARKTPSMRPYMVYPGNTQGLDRSESGEKGCYLVDVGAYGTVTLKFIVTDAIRWMDMEVDISSFQNPEELVREVVKQRATLREKTGKPNIVRLILRGQGVLQKAVSTPEGQAYILQLLNDKEKFHHIFCYFAEIQDETKPFLNLEERRKIPDVMGSYLRTFDKINGLSSEKRLAVLKKEIADRPEMAKFSRLMNMVSDDMIIRAFEKAEIKGAEMLAEDEG